MNTHYLDQLPGIWCEVDLNSKFKYVNQAYCNLVGVENPESLIGRSVADLPCRASEQADLFWNEDKKVLQTRKNCTFLNITQLANDEWKVITLEKTPIVNLDQEVGSILFKIDEKNNMFMKSYGLQLQKAVNKQIQAYDVAPSTFIISPADASRLTEKEQECLFYLLLGKTYKEIAETQSVSQRTIIDHIERLKMKFNCQSKSELIGRAIELGFNYHIPSSIFNQHVSLEIE